MHKIMLASQAHGGKSSVKGFLLDLFEERGENNVITLKMAEPMKNYTEWIGFDDENNPDVTKSRLFYQELSDLTKKHFGKMVFADTFKASHLAIEEDFDSIDAIVMDDCRIPFEFDLCEELGYTSIFIDCDEEVRKERAEKDAVVFSPNHNSENEVHLLKTRCNYIIDNSGSNLLDLKANVEWVFDQIIAEAKYHAK